MTLAQAEQVLLNYTGNKKPLLEVLADMQQRIESGFADDGLVMSKKALVAYYTIMAHVAQLAP